MQTALWIIDGLLLAVVGLWNYGAHWTPWQMVPFLVDEGGELHRVVAYVHGGLTILIACATWSLARWLLGVALVASWSAAVFLAGAFLSAGLGTITPRVFRWIVESQARQADRQDYEQALGG